MFRKIKKFILLPGEEKNLFYSAIKIALSSRLFILFRTSNKLPEILGNAHIESPYELSTTEDIIVAKVYRATRRSSVYLPFKEKCLIEAIVAKSLLKKYGMDSTLYLGVARDGNKELLAHAWLRYGNKIVVGKKGMDKYISVEWFT
jgi:hypothetical protein